MSTTHNSYFAGAVQSLGFERHGRRQTVGVVQPGEHHFGTSGAERMSIICGELIVRLDGQDDWRHYPQGTSFEIPANGGFSLKAATPTSYWCEFI